LRLKMRSESMSFELVGACGATSPANLYQLHHDVR
jgi:hypothetical protein